MKLRCSRLICCGRFVAFVYTVYPSLQLVVSQSLSAKYVHKDGTTLTYKNTPVLDIGRMLKQRKRIDTRLHIQDLQRPAYTPSSPLSSMPSAPHWIDWNFPFPCLAERGGTSLAEPLFFPPKSLLISNSYIHQFTCNTTEYTILQYTEIELLLTERGQL